ncbi:hypothetical protein HHX38_27020 [Streptomyces sp. PKU-MA01144]|uniref:hypothetical protein n=1 Tax=Streptomyces sp. PKU-MA01144 TaxID=2729138 RepID=UPI001480A4C9|nr:hypothetical protein [Streptomyces sp. PKU-MA01144]NNJ07751.1 hypothetical protein [Streptomyces sp. PKU-MA01144]
MINSAARIASALVVASLLLTACSGSDGEGAAPPAEHPVFSLPVDEQPYQTMRETQQSGSAAFHQTLTFTAKQGDAVLTTAGRLDFSGGRADGTHTWTIPHGLPATTKDILQGATWVEGSASARVALTPESVLHRSGEGDYWLRYDPDRLIDETDSISRFHGMESPFGGTLLEVITALHRIKGQPVTGGGRRFTAHIVPRSATESLLPGDLHRRMRAVGPAESAGTPVPLTLTTDAKGLITQVEADLSALLKGGDGGLPGVTALRVRLVLTGHGRTTPALPPGSDVVLDADKAVLPRYSAAAGDCVDFSTGTRRAALVVKVSCTGPHDARIYAQVKLKGAYTGERGAKRRAMEACGSAYRSARSAWTSDSVNPGEYWGVWPKEEHWDSPRERVATCYVLSR